MLIRIFEVEGHNPSTCLGIIDDYQSFNFTKKFKKAGEWTLKGYLTDDNRELLVPGHFMWVNPKVCGIIDGVEFFTDSEGITTYEAVGYELKHILSYRYPCMPFWHEGGSWSDGGGGESYYHWQSLEGFMRLCVINNCLPLNDTYTMGHPDPSRTLIDEVDNPASGDGFWTQPGVDNIGTPDITASAVLFDCFKSVEDNLLDMTRYTKSNRGLPVGFDVVCDDAKHFRFDVIEGADRSSTSNDALIFSREHDNITELSYTRSNRNTLNAIWAESWGKGRGYTENYDGRIWNTETGEWDTNPYTPKGLTRKEQTIDARNMDNRQLIGHSFQELSFQQFSEYLDGLCQNTTVNDIKSLEALITTKGKDLPDYSLLGATVSLIDKQYNLKVDDWISAINFIDEGGEIEINYKIGEDIQAKVLKEVR